MPQKMKPILKFIETKNGFNLCNKFGNILLEFDEQMEKELWDYFVRKRERNFKKTHPFKHAMVTKFSDMSNSEVRVSVKVDKRERFSGIITRITPNK